MTYINTHSDIVGVHVIRTTLQEVQKESTTSIHMP